MKVLFLHGWHSVPGGVKPTHLHEHGHDVINPALDDDDFEAAVLTAQAAFDAHSPDVIVGSSRGGAVAMALQCGNAPLVLLCPAWKWWGGVTTVKRGTRILHSPDDDTVPFTHSKELVERSNLPEALVPTGTDHRLADPQSLKVLIDACLASRPRLVGCDFGVPRTAGEQARKIILIEAVKLADRHYAIEPNGRNARLIQTHGAGNSWKARRRGWTLPELLLSLGADASVELAAFDFPFSLPVSLLRDEAFARPMNQPPFGTRNAWVSFVKSRMNLFFEDDSPNAPLRDLDTFQRWKEKRFWQKRVTDVATNGSPPLKHLFQNVFAMTIAGAAFLGGLEESGYAVLLDSARPTSRQSVFETYPRAVARRAGFAGSYKALPRDCMDHTIRFMSERGIRIDVDPGVRNFCETYRTAGNDPDGADAFLCLIAAICCAEGLAELCGHADAATLREEGAVIAPIISR